MKSKRKFLNAIGGRIRQLRLERGLTQEELAHLSGLHRTYISTLERGERNIAILNLWHLAKALKLSLSEMLADIG